MLSTRDSQIWEHLVASYKRYFSALHEFSSDGVDRVALIRNALRGVDRPVALRLAQHLKEVEHLQLFDSYVCGASSGHSDLEGFRELILRLPRDWVIERIETAVDPHLADGTFDEYRRFLELYIDLDRVLTLKLAKRAAAHSDPDIREAGEDFLQKLKGRTN